MYFSSILAIALVATTASAHQGHDINAEIARRRAFLATHTNNIDHCADMHKASGLQDRNIERRAKIAKRLAESPAIRARQVSSISKSHKSDKTYNASTDPKLVFGAKKSCVLTPEATEGPFYVMGEAIRSKIVDTEKGIPLYIDYQLIDVNTCLPVKGQFVEMWNTNCTGVYSGANAVVNGNGMGDKSNLNKQFLRGAQMTNDDGVVQFETLFPGHYAGRATHVHIFTHLNAKAEANNTIWHTTATHAGQIFFDQSLLTLVQKTPLYAQNRQSKTTNAADTILNLEAQTSDPFFDYVQLGDDINAGVFAWYTLAINTTFSRPIMAVAYNYKEGGQMATTNPKVPGLGQIFPGGFPTAYQPAIGGGVAAPQPTRPAKGKGTS